MSHASQPIRWRVGFRAARRLGLLLAVLCVPSTCHGADVAIESIDVGFDGYYVIGNWTPIVVTMQTSSESLIGTVELTLLDGDGIPCTYSRDEAIQLIPGEPLRIWCYAPIGNPDATIHVAFAVDGDTVVTRPFRAGDSDAFRVGLPTRRPFYLTLGSAAGIADAVGGELSTEKERPRVVALDGIGQLPTRWYGYDGVEAIVVSSSLHEQLTGLDPEGPRFRALDKWVRSGGRVLLAAGEHAPQMLAENGTWSRFGIGTYESTARIPFLRSLESYGETNSPIPANRDGYSVPKIIAAGGRIEVEESSVPLVIRHAHGFGTVIFTPFDLDRPPLSEWPGRAQFVRRLLGLQSKPATDADSIGDLDRSGVTDLAGQLRLALDEFETVQPVSFSIVAVLVLTYLVLLGPVDYFFVRRILGKPQATWVTFPLLIVFACVGAYFLARSFKGDTLRVNQVEIVDIDATSGARRGFTWANVFSPAMDRYDIHASVSIQETEHPSTEFLATWMGIPGQGFGGMDALSTAAFASGDGYRCLADQAGFSDVPIPVWSTKSFAVRWNSVGKTVTGHGLREFADGLLRGRLENPLDTALEECTLVYGNWAYSLESLGPQEMIEIDSQSERLRLTSKVTQQRLVFDHASQEYVQNAGPYDRMSRITEDILAQMMFYHSAGSADYTRLYNRYQSEVDVSNLLRSGRAVLVGQADRPVSRFRIDDASSDADGRRVTTFYRFVYPVDSASNQNEQ